MKSLKMGLEVIFCVLLLTGCAGNIYYKVTDLAPNKYKLVAKGTGFVEKDRLDEAFQKHAIQLCEQKHAKIEYSVEPYKYTTFGGVMNYDHDAFQATGTVTCQ